MAKSIILLHGWGSDLQSWHSLKQFLKSPDYQILLPPLPGFHGSDIKKPMTTQDYATWLKAIIQKQPQKKAILVAHSFGGQVAGYFSAHYPQLVSKLVLINSAGIRNKPNIKRLFFTPVAKLGKTLFQIPPFLFFKSLAKHTLYRFLNEVDYYQASPIMKKTLKTVITEDQQSNFKKITTPTLIIWGQNDTYTPLSDGQLIHQLIKKSKFKLIKNSRHNIYSTHPKIIASEIKQFIK